MNRTTKRLATLVLTAALGLMLGAGPASAAGGANPAPNGLGGCCGL